MCIEVNRMQALDLPYAPDLLIVPSDIQHFIKVREEKRRGRGGGEGERERERERGERGGSEREKVEKEDK